MGVLAMLELQGDTAELMAASAELDRLLPQPEGLLARIVAPTADGMVLFQLWASTEARQRNADDPNHAEALVVSGMREALRGSRSRGFDGAVLRRVAHAAPAATVARVATFDEAPTMQEDDDRRAASLRATVSASPGFVAGYHLREEESGRLMSVTVWESDEAMKAGEEKARRRPAADQRGIRPSRIERWVIDSAF